MEGHRGRTPGSTVRVRRGNPRPFAGRRVAPGEVDGGDLRMNPLAAGRELEDRDYARLLAFRAELRSFLRWSEEVAEANGLTPSLHQLLLVVRGHPGSPGPTIREAAEALQRRHHSTVELAQRAERAGLLRRERGTADRRLTILRLTSRGEASLETLTRQHLPRIERLAKVLADVVKVPMSS
jgi:DNA-binding MarR family transcriptional regulator